MIFRRFVNDDIVSVLTIPGLLLRPLPPLLLDDEPDELPGERQGAQRVQGAGAAVQGGAGAAGHHADHGAQGDAAHLEVRKIPEEPI